MLRLATLAVVLGVTSSAHAGELDLSLGLQATHTDWPDDRGGGPTLSAGWWFTPALGASFVGKTHYAAVDERYVSYLSLNAAARHDLGRVRLGGTLGVVHEHEETRAAIEAMPLASVFGVADGIRHRMAARAGASLAIPFRDRAAGDWYVALDLDATVFTDDDRGPRWMTSAGLAVGFTHDFAVRR